MAVKKILRMGHPILRKKASALSLQEIHSAEMKMLVRDLIDTMREAGGVGIAAPQMGVEKQVAIIEISQSNKRYPQTSASAIPLMVVINPTITVIDPTLQGYWEGCLSLPGLRGFVQRPRHIRVEYLDIDGASCTLEAQDFLATVLQHELDHLFGRLYIDHIKDLQQLSYTEEFIEWWAPKETSAKKEVDTDEDVDVDVDEYENKPK